MVRVVVHAAALTPQSLPPSEAFVSVHRELGGCATRWRLGQVLNWTLGPALRAAPGRISTTGLSIQSPLSPSDYKNVSVASLACSQPEQALQRKVKAGLSVR